ncbi:hypothetical protein Tsedi_01501 [Tepidimonas sediminis]|uniref:EamA-like transporter family protein n=1 Tax=Tepidimonas sediminis TaxID=2588941 RepID=A0A554WNV5_9BURK|nr:hypothetical protein [Tepidimonas sediminis]TSE25254.1 hypothetical protein Tsedi_01501 [Tepidimonas sediminis]
MGSVGLGAWLLDEPLTPGFVTGAGLVLAGALLVNGHALLQGWWRRLRGASAAP